MGRDVSTALREAVSKIGAPGGVVSTMIASRLGPLSFPTGSVCVARSETVPSGSGAVDTIDQVPSASTIEVPIGTVAVPRASRSAQSCTVAPTSPVPLIAGDALLVGASE